MDSKNKDHENPQTIEDFLFLAKNYLKNFKNRQLESEILLSKVLKKNRVWLKINPKYILKTSEQVKFQEFLAQRKDHEPLAYIIGKKTWSNLKLKVCPKVLIPRDETEILIKHILETSRNFQVKSILDIGTGTGCIAIILGKNFPQAKIMAIDISTEALSIAEENAKNHQIAIKLIQSDLLGNEEIPRNFDIIVANLPYVPESLSVSPEVKKEPESAIFSGQDGLLLIRKLAEKLKSRRILFRELWLEFLPQQQENIREIFAEFSVEFYPDVSGQIYFAKVT